MMANEYEPTVKVNIAVGSLSKSYRFMQLSY